MQHLTQDGRRVRPWLRTRVLLGMVTASLLLAACGSDSDSAQAPSAAEGIMGNATPLAAGPAHAQVPGVLAELPHGVEYLVIDPAAPAAESALSALAVAETGEASLARVNLAAGVEVEGRVEIAPAEAEGVSRAPSRAQNGVVLLPGRDKVVRIDLREQDLEAAVSTWEIPGDWTAAGWQSDQTAVVADGAGQLRFLSGSGEELGGATVAGDGGVQGIAHAGAETLVLNRTETLLTAVNDANSADALALRAGLAAARLDAVAETVAVTDVTAGQLLVFGTDPLRQQQSTPVPPGVWGVAVSAQRPQLIWATFAQSNTVRGFDISSGQAREVAVFPTGVDPRSVQETAAGALLIGHSDGSLLLLEPPVVAEALAAVGIAAPPGDGAPTGRVDG